MKGGRENGVKKQGSKGVRKQGNGSESEVAVCYFVAKPADREPIGIRTT